LTVGVATIVLGGCRNAPAENGDFNKTANFHVAAAIAIETNLRALPLFLDVMMEAYKNASAIPGYVMEIGIVQEVKTREAGLYPVEARAVEINSNATMDNAFQLNMNVTESPFGVMTVMIEVMNIGDVIVKGEHTGGENFPCSKNDRIGRLCLYYSMLL